MPKLQAHNFTISALVLALGCAKAAPEPVTEAAYGAEFAKQAIPAFEHQIASGPKPTYCVLAAPAEGGPDWEEPAAPTEALLRLLNTDPQREYFAYDQCRGPVSRLLSPAGTEAGILWTGPLRDGRISGGVAGWGYGEVRECTFMENRGRLLLERCQVLREH